MVYVYLFDIWNENRNVIWTAKVLARACSCTHMELACVFVCVVYGFVRFLCVVVCCWVFVVSAFSYAFWIRVSALFSGISFSLIKVEWDGLSQFSHFSFSFSAAFWGVNETEKRFQAAPAYTHYIQFTHFQFETCVHTCCTFPYPRHSSFSKQHS